MHYESQSLCDMKLGIACNLAVALAVQEDVGRFLVAVNDVSRVEVVGGAEQLVHDEALVNILQDTGSEINN